jgi:hypothetical protein
MLRIWMGVLVLGTACAGAAGEVFALAHRKEPFLDRAIIETLAGAALRLHAPVPAGEAFRFDAPWEGAFSGYVTLVQDAALLRAYYRGLPVSGKDGSDGEVTCVAESADGVQWTKPALGLFDVGGSRANNVVLAGQAPFSHNFAPFLDTRPEVPAAERYKALAGTSETGLHAFVSADGLRWQKAGTEAVITKGAFDSQNVSFWSASEQTYVCYFRTWSAGEWDGFRTVSRCTSPDFKSWSEPVPMTFADAPMEHLYTNQTTPYPGAPHLYVGIAARFMPGRRVISEAQAAALKVDPKYFGDCSDGVLLSSRGGTVYDRTFMEGYIRPGIGPEHWTSRTNYPAHGIAAIDETSWAIYVQADYGQPHARLDRYTLRADGFASLSAPYAGGTMTTKLLTFAGDALWINFATSAAGEIRVAVLDAAGSALDGFALEDCAPVIGNDVARVVTWASGKSLADIAGQPVRLYFALKDADLFALRFK